MDINETKKEEEYLKKMIASVGDRYYEGIFSQIGILEIKRMNRQVCQMCGIKNENGKKPVKKHWIHNRSYYLCDKCAKQKREELSKKGGE